VRLNSLHLVNFRQHADSRIEFDAGLTGIIGQNGSGKTTILEAIAWALYGNAAARGTRDSLRFSGAPARASVRVELDFELAGHRYRVVRGLNSAELYLDGAGTPIANSITGVTELLQRRLGMTRTEFFNTYFTGQKELNVMAALGPSDRAKFLSRVLGYERLRTAQDLVRDRRKLITAEMAGLRSGMPDRETIERIRVETSKRLAAAELTLSVAERRVRETETVLAAITPEWTRVQHERDQFQELLGDLKVAEGSEDALARDSARIAREVAAVAAAKDELEPLRQKLSAYHGILTELKGVDELYLEEGKRQILLDSQRVLQDEIGRLKERREKAEGAPALEEEVTLELETRRRELEETLGQLEARRTEWVRDRQEAETKRQALRTQYADVKQQRDRLVAAGEEGTCPTCARPLGGHFQTVLELLDEQAETVRVDGNYYKARLEQLEQMPADVRALDERRRLLTQDVGTLERKLAKVQLAVQDLQQASRDLTNKEQRRSALERDIEAIAGGYDATRHAHLKSEAERLAPLNDRVAVLNALVEREPQLAEEKLQLEAAAAAVFARLKEIRARRDGINFSEKAYLDVRSRHDRASADARAAEIAGLTAKADLSAARNGVEQAEASRRELEKLQRKLDTLQRDKRLHEELDRAFSDLRTDLNFALRPEVSELASGFLVELTDGRYTELELDDQYNIIVLEEGIPKPVISGGEEDIAHLVLRLAISQMIAERTGQSFSLLVLDEVFGSLDELRRTNVVELLRRLHDRFEQVIVITHIESVREGLDRVISVRYDEDRGCSIVEQAEHATLSASDLAEAAPIDDESGALAMTRPASDAHVRAQLGSAMQEMGR
jgi:exonuclease SbcC